MGSKRKPESSLRSEPSSKIRRIDKNSEDHEEVQYAPVVYSPATQQNQQDLVLTPSEPTPAPLTKANLRQLEKMTKNGSGSKSGKSVYSSKTEQTTTTTPSARSKTYSTTDHQFEAIFRKNGGLDPDDSDKHPPSNEKEIQDYLNKSRGSASPTRSQHRDFRKALFKAGNEREIEGLFQGAVYKDTNKTSELLDIDYGANIDRQWVAFPKDVGFNDGLSAPKPDRTEGYAQRTFPESIHRVGGAATLVHDSPAFVGLPHIATEFKAHGKSMLEAEVQAGYDGAHMVYGRNKTLELIGEKDPPRHASPISVTSDGHYWTVYSHYAHENENKNKLEYYQNEIATGKTTNFEDFKRSYKTFRNAQDWGRKESHELRSRMQQHEDVSANQARSGSRTGSLAGGSSNSSARGGAFQPPRRRMSDAGSRRSDGQASSSSTKSGERPSMTGYAGTSGLAAQTQASPSSNKAMLPPPTSKSSSAGGRAADARGSARSPSTSRYPPSASSAGSGAPRSPSNSGSVGGRVADTRGSVRSPSISRYPPSASGAIGPGAGVGTPKSSRSPSVSSSASKDKRAARDRSRDRRPSVVDARRTDRRDGDGYVNPARPSVTDQYRDRRSDDGIQPVQRRRSDSPQDKPRPPRDLDRGRYRDRDDRR